MAPRKLVVVDPARHAVITDGNDFVVPVDDASPDLSRGIFATEGAKLGHSHEVFVPFEIIRAVFFFHDQKLPFGEYSLSFPPAKDTKKELTEGRKKERRKNPS